VDPLEGAAVVGGGEADGWGREGGWCLVRIHSGPKCIVVVVILTAGGFTEFTGSGDS
jgi:hypothetical protein